MFTQGMWPVMHHGHAKVLREIVVHGPAPRAEIARRLDLSRASLSRIAKELSDFGFVRESSPQRTSTRGRPAELLLLEPGSAHFAGIKITATDLYAVATDFSATVVAERRIPLHTTDAQTVADLIAAAAGNVFRGHPLPAAVGICLGGTVVDQGGVSVVERGSFLHWDHVPIAAMVQERLRIPASVMNDVTALTVGHHWFGAGVGQDSLLVYGVGAGIGAGIVMHNRVVTGAHGISGHVGHERVGGRGVTCGRGHTDCVHSFVSIPAITQNAEANSYEEALERADRGVSVALRAFRSAAHALGVTVAEAVNIIDPGRVIVTGEGLDMLRIAEPSFHEGVVDHLEQRDAETVEIVFPAFDFTHYARGAAIAAMSALL